MSDEARSANFVENDFSLRAADWTRVKFENSRLQLARGSETNVGWSMIARGHEVTGRVFEWGGSIRMETERILEAAVAGIPRVAKTIADIPTGLRERAFEAAERSYQQTARGLGLAEADAQVWVCAVVFRLRSQVAE